MKEIKFSTQTEQYQDPSMITVVFVTQWRLIRLDENSSVSVSLPRYSYGSSRMFCVSRAVSSKSSVDHSTPKILSIWHYITPRLHLHPAVVSLFLVRELCQKKKLKWKNSWLKLTHLPAAVFKLINRRSWKMKTTPRMLFFFVQFLLPYFSRTEFCYESQGSILYNQVLIGHAYKSFLTRGILNCGQKCLADPHCASYNYQTSAIKDGTCELNENRIERKELFEERRGFAFVRMRRKTVGSLDSAE